MIFIIKNSHLKTLILKKTKSLSKTIPVSSSTPNVPDMVLIEVELMKLMKKLVNLGGWEIRAS